MKLLSLLCIPVLLTNAGNISTRVETINAKQTIWKAAKNFIEESPEEFLKNRLGFLGLHPDPNYKINLTTHVIGRTMIPASFDAREYWPLCKDVIGNIRDQGKCGSCWAFSSAEVMSDRLCIQSKGKIKFEFSPEDLMSCCSNCGHGCKGGYTLYAWNYLIREGIVSGSDYNSNRGCQPYQELPYIYGITPSCNYFCLNSGYAISYSIDKRYGKSYSRLSPDVQQIQMEIMTNGPVQANYLVYEDFSFYEDGVYYHIEGKFLGNHAVKIIGWGVEKETPYWLVANSWGTSWANLSGYFKIRRGTNECQIESNVVGGKVSGSIKISFSNFGLLISFLLFLGVK